MTPVTDKRRDGNFSDSSPTEVFAYLLTHGCGWNVFVRLFGVRRRDYVEKYQFEASGTVSDAL